VGPRAGLDTEARGKILSLLRGSNLDRPVVQPVAIDYTILTDPPGSPTMGIWLMLNKEIKAVETENCKNNINKN
jgi:predicted DNA-binding transcriptional regulator